MVPLSALWLPILLSAVFVFIVSSIIHMFLPLHKSDYAKIPDEEKVMDAIRASNSSPGKIYFFPFHNMKDMKSPEVQEKFKRGPVGMMTLRPAGVPGMGKFLLQWFIYCIVISIFAAYLTGRTRLPGAEYLEVFRIAGTTAFLGYGGALLQNSIWKGEPWSVTVKHLIDALIYCGVTALTFGWLWPK